MTKYIERMGTGTGDMIKRCRSVGLDEPTFALTDGFLATIRRKPELAFKTVGGITGEVTGEVEHPIGTRLALSRHQVAILHKCLKENSISVLMEIAGRTDRTKFRNQVLNPLLHQELLEMTVPGKPSSPLQKYRLTAKGHAYLTELAKEEK